MTEKAIKETLAKLAWVAFAAWVLMLTMGALHHAWSQVAALGYGLTFLAVFAMEFIIVPTFRRVFRG